MLSAVSCSGDAALCSGALHCIITRLYCTALHYAALHNTALHYATLLHSDMGKFPRYIAPYHPTLHNALLHYIALFTVPNYAAPQERVDISEHVAFELMFARHLECRRMPTAWVKTSGC